MRNQFLDEPGSSPTRGLSRGLSMFVPPQVHSRIHLLIDLPYEGGSWITDADSQRILLDFLKRVEAENAWPTSAMVQDLTDEWNIEGAG
jgi:hypothetical protein